MDKKGGEYGSRKEKELPGWKPPQPTTSPRHSGHSQSTSINITLSRGYDRSSFSVVVTASMVQLPPVTNAPSRISRRSLVCWFALGSRNIKEVHSSPIQPSALLSSVCTSLTRATAWFERTASSTAPGPPWWSQHQGLFWRAHNHGRRLMMQSSNDGEVVGDVVSLGEGVVEEGQATDHMRSSTSSYFDSTFAEEEYERGKPEEPHPLRTQDWKLEVIRYLYLPTSPSPSLLSPPLFF